MTDRVNEAPTNKEVSKEPGPLTAGLFKASMQSINSRTKLTRSD